MTTREQVLIRLLRRIRDQNYRAVVVQSFIAEEGPLSKEAAAKVRELLR